MAKETQSKTPKFDALLDGHFEKLVPHTRICKWKEEHQHCEKEFEITDEDIKFLKMLRAPAPNYCPTCRRIRRFVYMGLSQLFKIKCQAPGHKESIISILSSDCPFPVYDYKYFISDKFNPFLLGRKYEEGSPLEFLFEMRKEFPMPSFLNRDPSSVNSEYSNGGRNLKNGYYVFACYNSENIWYSSMASQSKNVMDSRYANKCENSYSVVHSDNIYNSSFLYFSKDCTDSMFLFDCRNCQDCFGCVNLRNKKYCVWNKQLSKEDYDEFIKSISPLRRDDLKNYKDKWWELVKTLPLNASRNIAVENVSGVMLLNTRNSFDVTASENSEHIRHADGGLSHEDSMDFIYSGGDSSLVYETINIGSQSSNVKFSVSSKFCTNSEFIFNSKNLDNCFMCFVLQNKSYCVLNKQYSKEEYWPSVDKIKCEMWERGEYGDGFPMKFSAQAYNMSIASVSFPLSDEEIVKLGGYLAKEPESNAGEIKTLSGKDIPETIDEATDDVVNHGIACDVTGKPFRITPSELQFYRRMKIPIPSVHP